jgi:hypothetical protein
MKIDEYFRVFLDYILISYKALSLHNLIIISIIFLPLKNCILLISLFLAQAKKRLLIPVQRWSLSVMGLWSAAVSSGMVGDPDWNVCGHLGKHRLLPRQRPKTEMRQKH